MSGAKFDEGKVRFDLLLPEWELAVAKVMTHGAGVHGDNSWQTVPNGENRYYAALRRHLNAFRSGEELDKESGLPHLAHVAVNAMFLMTLFEMGKD